MDFVNRIGTRSRAGRPGKRVFLLLVIGAFLGAGCSQIDDMPGVAMTTSGGEVVLVSTDGSPGEPLASGLDTGPPIQATPGPNGTLVWVAGSDPRPAMSIWADGKSRTVDTPFVPFYFSWSPDGSRLAMLGNGSNGVAGAIYEPATGDFIDLGSATPFFFDWSPDGSVLVAHLDGTTLETIDARSGRRSGAIDLSEGYGAPQFLADGRVLSVRRARGATAALGSVQTGQLLQAATWELTVTDLEAGTSLVLARVGPRTAFAASRDRVAFVTAPASGALLLGPLSVVDLDGEGRMEVTDADVVAFEWSPDGSHLLYFAVDTVAARLEPSVWNGSESTAFDTFRPTAVTASQYLPFADQYARSQTAWSSDGSAFTYADRGEEDPTIVIQRLDGSMVRVEGGESATWMR